MSQIADPASDVATTLSAVAIRIGLKMGLDKDSDVDGLTFFEQEMRVRLWWQICTQDILARHLFTSRSSKEATVTMAPDIRLPLNVDDAELHPDMIKPPVEYPKASEMICVLMRYEGASWGHRQRTQRQSMQDLKDFSFDELENLIEEKYLRHCDVQVPLHAAAMAMNRSITLIVRYMRDRIKAGNVVPSDSLLKQAIEVLELDETNRKLPFAAQLLWHGGPIQLDAVIHVITRLREPVRKDVADKAWELVTHFWDEQIDGDWEDDEAFLRDLLDLTMEAWHQRRGEMAHTYGSTATESLTPKSIKRLQEIQRAWAGEQVDNTLSSTTQAQLDSTTDGSLLTHSEFDISTMNITQDWFEFNNNHLYNYGYWTDFSLV